MLLFFLVLSFFQAVSLQARLTSDSLSSAFSLPRARITGALHTQPGLDTRKLLSFLSLTLPHYQCFHALWVIISYRPDKPQGIGERHDPILEKNNLQVHITKVCVLRNEKNLGKGHFTVHFPHLYSLNVCFSDSELFVEVSSSQFIHTFISFMIYIYVLESLPYCAHHIHYFTLWSMNITLSYMCSKMNFFYILYK